MRQESLVFGGVLLVAAAIVSVFVVQSGKRETLLDEGRRMQNVYVGLSLYESDSDGAIPPDLLAAQRFLNPRDLVSPKDPYREAPGPFPIDPGILDSAKKSPVRISDGYLWAHVTAGKLRVAPWATSRLDRELGVLANEWQGTVRPTGEFGAEVSGEILRINTEGALIRVPSSGSRPVGNSELLFRTRP